MQSTSSVTTCNEAGLSLGGVTLPDSSDWTDPSIGAKPAVTGSPSIIGGEKGS